MVFFAELPEGDPWPFDVVGHPWLPAKIFLGLTIRASDTRVGEPASKLGLDIETATAAESRENWHWLYKRDMNNTGPHSIACNKLGSGLAKSYSEVRYDLAFESETDKAQFHLCGLDHLQDYSVQLHVRGRRLTVHDLPWTRLQGRCGNFSIL